MNVIPGKENDPFSDDSICPLCQLMAKHFSFHSCDNPMRQMLSPALRGWRSSICPSSSSTHLPHPAFCLCPLESPDRRLRSPRMAVSLDQRPPSPHQSIPLSTALLPFQLLVLSVVLPLVPLGPGMLSQVPGDCPFFMASYPCNIFTGRQFLY